MPKLLKNIEAQICDNNEAVVGFGMVNGYVDIEDYIKIQGLTGYLQNFLKISLHEEFMLNKNFGLQNDNKKIIELNISY